MSRGVFYLLFPPRTRLKKGHKSGPFLMSSMRFLAVKWGFKARHRGDDHAYSVISSKTVSVSDFLLSLYRNVLRAKE